MCFFVPSAVADGNRPAPRARAAKPAFFKSVRRSMGRFLGAGAGGGGGWRRFSIGASGGRVQCRRAPNDSEAYFSFANQKRLFEVCTGRAPGRAATGE